MTAMFDRSTPAEAAALHFAGCRSSNVQLAAAALAGRVVPAPALVSPHVAQRWLAKVMEGWDPEGWLAAGVVRWLPHAGGESVEIARRVHALQSPLDQLLEAEHGSLTRLLAAAKGSAGWISFASADTLMAVCSTAWSVARRPEDEAGKRLALAHLGTLGFVVTQRHVPGDTTWRPIETAVLGMESGAAGLLPSQELGAALTRAADIAGGELTRQSPAFVGARPAVIDGLRRGLEEQVDGRDGTPAWLTPDLPVEILADQGVIGEIEAASPMASRVSEQLTPVQRVIAGLLRRERATLARFRAGKVLVLQPTDGPAIAVAPDGRICFPAPVGGPAGDARRLDRFGNLMLPRLEAEAPPRG